MISRLFLAIILIAAACLPAHAQVTVDLKIKRPSYIRYEPVLATVTITNLSGRDLTLHDGETAWFGFQITANGANDIIPPRNPDYHLDPLEIKLGETVKRTVNLTSLYSISEYGLHKVRASVYVADSNKYFTSRPNLVEITEGTSIWKTTVGVPETLPNAGCQHTITLLEHIADNHRQLYARVEDRELGKVFCTYQLGHMIDGESPMIQLDTENNLYVLHCIGPKTYQLSSVGVNGEFLGRHIYLATKSRPVLRRTKDGTLQIVGGRRQEELAQNTPAQKGPQPKLSDRPVAIPAN